MTIEATEPAFRWTDDTEARLTALWGAGKSASQIAAEIGATRNQVIGKAHRLKLSARPSPIIRNAAGVELHRLQPHHCRFPMWQHGERSNGLYCGKPRDLTAYCGEHQARCYQQGTGYLLQEARRKAQRAERRKQMVFGSAA